MVTETLLTGAASAYVTRVRAPRGSGLPVFHNSLRSLQDGCCDELEWPGRGSPISSASTISADARRTGAVPKRSKIRVSWTVWISGISTDLQLWDLDCLLHGHHLLEPTRLHDKIFDHLNNVLPACLLQTCTCGTSTTSKTRTTTTCGCAATVESTSGTASAPRQGCRRICR